jgi:hypothetical protein
MFAIRRSWLHPLAPFTNHASLLCCFPGLKYEPEAGNNKLKKIVRQMKRRHDRDTHSCTVCAYTVEDSGAALASDVAILLPAAGS